MPDDILERAARAMEGISPGQWSSWIYRYPNRVTVADREIASLSGADWKQVEADTRFIAAAPGLVRDLMAEIKRLRMGGKDG